MPKREEIITTGQFTGLVRAGEVERGDLVLFDYGQRNLVQRAIESVQRRLLADLVGPRHDPARMYLANLLGEGWLRDAARFTHAATVLDQFHAGEMTYPRARSIVWPRRLAPGDRILVRRPYHALTERDAPWHARDDIGDWCERDVYASLGYPWYELLHYWLWSWSLQKLVLGRRFMAVFSSDTADVCSGRYWYWALQAGCWADLDDAERRPEGHYPAELAVSFRFRTVGEYRIRAGETARTAAPSVAIPQPQPQPLEA
jgi:hypothetical protein